MKEHRYDIYIEEKLNGTRLDVVLSFSVPEVSRSFVQKLIDGGAVSVDGKVCLSKKEKETKPCLKVFLWNWLEEP